ncbi:MAG: hypothetical protein OXR68_08255 [Alphaproteobacteria bacterium]|nr:hypothetical protein [Alphaproteobacteria bacterium]MDD9920597.1 hypothetical protein [Alphaproteobacteria bacterium]
MNKTFFVPESFPHHSWTPGPCESWVEKLENVLDWLMGLDGE